MEENLKFKQIAELNKCTFSPCLSRKSSSLKKYMNFFNLIRIFYFSYENIIEKTKKFAEKFEYKIKINEVKIASLYEISKKFHINILNR